MILYLTQLIASSVVFLLLKVFTRFELYGRDNLSGAHKPVLITANHKSMIDSFVIGAVVVFSRKILAPVRFMAKDRLFLIPGLNLLIWSLGAFRARKKQGLERTLETPTRMLRQGGTVLIFPEAHIVPDLTRLGGGRKGAASLAYSTDATLLPVSFFVSEHLTLKAFFTNRPRIVVRFGQPYSLGVANPHLTDEQLQVATGTIMQEIWELYRQDLPRLANTSMSTES